MRFGEQKYRLSLRKSYTVSCVHFSHKNTNATNCSRSQTKTKALICLITEMWTGAKATQCSRNVGKDLTM